MILSDTHYVALRRAHAVSSSPLSTFNHNASLWLNFAIGFSHSRLPFLLGPQFHRFSDGHHHVDIECSQPKWNCTPRRVWLVPICVCVTLPQRLQLSVFVHIHMFTGFRVNTCVIQWLSVASTHHHLHYILGTCLPYLTCIGVAFESQWYDCPMCTMIWKILMTGTFKCTRNCAPEPGELFSLGCI